MYVFNPGRPVVVVVKHTQANHTGVGGTSSSNNLVSLEDRLRHHRIDSRAVFTFGTPATF